LRKSHKLQPNGEPNLNEVKDRSDMDRERRGAFVRLTRRARGVLAGGVLAAATIVATVAGADVGFIRNGPFEACLNGAYTDWLRHQAELLVNEDKRAHTLTDASVAAWTSATVDDCRKKGEASASSIDFGRHMARWRNHVFKYSVPRAVGLTP
jgi:hypothetical protein